MNTILSGDQPEIAKCGQGLSLMCMILCLNMCLLNAIKQINTPPPWIAPQLRKEINKKNQLYFKAGRTKQPELWAKYKAWKQETQKALRNSEWMHMNDILLKALFSNDNIKTVLEIR